MHLTQFRIKNLVSLLVILVVGAAMFGSHKTVAFAASQSKGTITQSEDPCGGTGGKGEIVNVENKTVTIKRNDGSNQIILLTNQATIETSTGSISLSKLKKGERITLVGGANPDGSFTADTVVVCKGNQENRTGQAPVRKENTGYKKISGIINISTVVLFGLIWFGITVSLRLKRKKSLVYLLFFTIFYVYLYKVLDYTLLQFQSLLLLKHFMPDLMINGLSAGKSVNLFPLFTLKPEDLKTSFLNILLMMPFGFGLPFVSSFRMKKIVIAGFILSIIIEFLQLITGVIANTTFRVADVNDLIFNTVGAAIGYILFVEFLRIFRQIFRNTKISSNQILRYIIDRPQIDK